MKQGYWDWYDNWKGGGGGGTPPPRPLNSGGKYVWWDRNWVPYDPNKHQGLPTYDTYMNIAPGSTPYYATDVSSTLMQNAFPGAAAGYAFGSTFLEPQRQRGIMDLLNMTTLSGANRSADAYQKAMTGNALGQGKQRASFLYGRGNAPKSFMASSALASNNQANENAAAYRAQVADPFRIAARRQSIIEGGFNNPMAEAVRGWIPGLEPRRQNNNFWGQLFNTAANVVPFMNFGGGGGGGGNGGGFPWGLALSDRRLKSNVSRIGTLKNGLGVYDYTIMGRRQRGVMAQEVEKVMPEAVYKVVDYTQLFKALK